MTSHNNISEREAVLAKIEWPLAGKRVVITRSVEQAEELSNLLISYGAKPIPYPCIAIEPPHDTSLFDKGIRDTIEGEFDWLILTSKNVVRAIAQRMKSMNLEVEELGDVPLAAIGPATAKAARDILGLNVDLMPDEYVAEALAKVMRPIAGSRIFLPQSDIGREVLYEELTNAGAEVVTVTAYQTVIGRGGADLRSLLAHSLIDVITFTSPSTVNNFMIRLKTEACKIELLKDIVIACIGSVTAESAEKQGLKVTVMPAEHTLEGMMNGLAEYFTVNKKSNQEKSP